MNSSYKKLTIEDLIIGGITNCTEDGRIFINNKEVKYFHIKSGYKGKYYIGFNMYDHDLNGKRIKINKIHYWTNKDGTIHSCSSYMYKNRIIGVHRAVWLWNEYKKNGTREIPAGYDIDHIDNITTNNSYDNLQLLNRADNLAKNRKPTQYKARMAGVRVKYTREYILNKIRYHEARLTLVRNSRTKDNYKEIAEKDHKIRSSISQWKNRLKQFDDEQ